MSSPWLSSRSTVAAALCAALFSDHAGAASAPSATAARFVDSIGLNVHSDPAYLKARDVVTARLGELGVMHIRDGIHPKACESAMTNFNASGVKTTWITGRRMGGGKEYLSPLNPAGISEELREVRELALPATEAIEGPNEYDIHSDARDPDWPATLRNYQAKVYEHVKADPKLRGFPVVGPSLTSEDAFRKVGDLDQWMDAACIHHYQSFRNPGTPGWGAGGYGSIDWTRKSLVALLSPQGKPLWSTECGYRVTGGESVSEAIDAKYLPRMFAEFFRKGYFRSFRYELMGSDYGLIDAGLRARPAFYSMKHLIGILKDVPGEGGKVPDFTVSGGPPDLRQILLGRSNGDFDLLVWREAVSWDGVKREVVEVKPAPVALTFRDAALPIKIFVPSVSGEVMSEREARPDHRLEVGDDLMIVRLGAGMGSPR